jgi:hypothetical protein
VPALYLKQFKLIVSTLKALEREIGRRVHLVHVSLRALLVPYSPPGCLSGGMVDGRRSVHRCGWTLLSIRILLRSTDRPKFTEWALQITDGPRTLLPWIVRGLSVCRFANRCRYKQLTARALRPVSPHESFQLRSEHVSPPQYWAYRYGCRIRSYELHSSH